MATIEPTPVGPNVLTLTCYGLIGLPLAAATLPLYVHIPNFYAVDLGLGLAAVGAIMFAMRIWDVVTDPVVGILSDRIGTRFGRRRFWLALGIPVAMIGGWMIFRPPETAGLSYLLVAGLVLHLGWTMVSLPYNAWGAEMTPDYHGRNKITAWREIFVIAGTLVAGGLVAAASNPEGRAEALGMVGIFLAVGLPLAALVLFWKVPEPARPTPVRDGQNAAGKSDTPHSWRASMRLIAQNKPFRLLISAWILNGIANGLPATLFILFVSDILAEPDRSGLYLLAYFIVAVLGMPFWVWLSRRIGKHRTWCGAMIWACGWFALAPFLGAGDGHLYLALCIGTGLALGADLALPPSIQADVVDQDTAEGGGARTGTFFALWGMATKLALALAVGIAFPALEWAGFEAATPGIPQTGEGVFMLALLYGAVPIGFKLAAIALMWRFPLDAAEHQALRARLGSGD